MKQPECKRTVSKATLLHDKVNQLRRRDGLEPISLIALCHKISMFHRDNNPRVAEALGELGMTILPVR